MVVKKFGCRIVVLARNGPTNGDVIDLWVVANFRFVSSSHTAICSFDANCLGVIWSSLTGN